MGVFKRGLFYAVLLLVLLSTSQVSAQGNDFPSPGFPVPDFSSPVPSFPSYGGQYYWGATKWGPQVVDARKGDTIVFDYVGRYWNFAIMQSTPMISNGSDMGLTDPYSAGWVLPLDNGFNVTYCQRCEFSVKAGEDYPSLWIAYNGNSDWDAYLQVKYVIPAPVPPPSSWFSVLSDPSKSQASTLSSMFNSMFWFFTGATAGFYAEPPLSAIMGVLAIVSDKISGHYAKVDPWDGNYCSETTFEVATDLDWAYEYDIHSGGWLVYSAQVIDGLFIQAETAIDRAFSAAQDGNMDCAWARRGEAIWALNTTGWYFWALRHSVEAYVNAYPDYDLSSVSETLINFEEAGYWAGGIQ